MRDGLSIRQVPMRRSARYLVAPIGKNQGVQFPIARAYVQTEAAAQMVAAASDLFDAG